MREKEKNEAALTDNAPDIVVDAQLSVCGPDQASISWTVLDK